MPTQDNSSSAYNCRGHANLQCVRTRRCATDATLFADWHSHELASNTESRNRVSPTSTLLSPTRVTMQLLPLHTDWLRMYSFRHPHMIGVQHVHLSRALCGLRAMRHRSSAPLLRDAIQSHGNDPFPRQRSHKARQACLYFGFYNGREPGRSTLTADRSMDGPTGDPLQPYWFGCLFFKKGTREVIRKPRRAQRNRQPCCPDGEPISGHLATPPA